MSVSCDCCELSGRCVCDGPITRLCDVCVCESVISNLDMEEA
jgi:hypothetical protein